jgi:nicotinate-nucleotide pyrophosphorylase (carboxylating)
MSISDIEGVTQLIELARREDLGQGDLTTSLIANPNEPAEFRVVLNQPGVFAGREIASAILGAYDSALAIEWTNDGVDGRVNDDVPVELARLRGPLAALLAVERVLLNFLQRLCGVATFTRALVEAVSGTGAAVYDTRKTTPGWRALEKYAVRCGGGRNHRHGLFDAVLIKDNHLSAAEKDHPAPAVYEMLNRLTSLAVVPDFVEVEAGTLDQVEELFKVMGIHLILLDNFAIDELRRAVELRDGYGLGGKVQLEASGGITLKTVREVARTGVDRISVGALTHSAVALDISLERC